MSRLCKPIILIGFMASGKTTIGKELSKILNRDFIDTDELIEKRVGLGIKEIFQRYGEDFFRDTEEKIISEVIKDDNTVIATGGGCILRETTRRLLKEKGLVFWLKVDPETVMNRTDNDNTRPLLLVEKEEKIRTLLAQREHLYRETAHYIIDATEPVESAVSEILTSSGMI
ncbi:MAG TPA: shikimate kinase [bacterium]|jgi:shikimate kinase|nr:shikimate kinase [Dictyoglomota bacterium]HOL54578.1 shikimate kinase [bacterium]HOP56155.1 shikimate kinase [bacterium]HPO81332.1 shikimate kinase [bacterium]